MTTTRATSWVGQTLELEVGAVAHGGHCVARVDGRVVFVRHALPGELVRARVTEDNGGAYCRADCVEVLRPAAQRVEPPCPVARPGGCGGCDWQHADPAYQRELKARVVAEQLRRLAGVEWPVTVEKLPGGPLRWRGRVRLVAGDDGRAGLRAHREHRVIPLDDCPIALPEAVEDVLHRNWKPGSEIEVTIDDAGARHVRQIVPTRQRNQVRQLQGGRAALHAAGRNWDADAHGFWQPHVEGAAALAGAVEDWAQVPTGGRAWDLYAGVGLFASVLAAQAGANGQVLAVEQNRRAVADGETNLADLPQVSWRTARVNSVVPTLTERPDVVVLDPPRKGAGRGVVDAIAAHAPGRVVYVACDPAALARDVATFAEHGYELTALRGFDAFPMTHHVECVALLTS